jgi:ATP-dependent exoDNAse (exonuclease V) alpha subunit
MAGSRHFHRRLTLTRERDWKAVLVGDTKQFPSIAAGRNHSLLQERSGVDTVHLTEVVRQETEHARAVVSALSRGDTDRALRELRGREALRQIGDREERLGAVVERYISLRDGKRQVLLLSATNADRIELNERIRSALVSRGDLEPGRSFRVQEPTGAGPEETALASSYEAGQRVLLLGDVGGGLNTGTHAPEVVGVDRDRNRVRVEAGGKTHENLFY